MIDIGEDIHSLTEFKTRTSEFLEQLKEGDRAVILTVNGKAEAAVMGAATFQRVLEALDSLDAVRGVRDGLDDITAGRTRTLEEFIAAVRGNGHSSRQNK